MWAHFLRCNTFKFSTWLINGLECTLLKKLGKLLIFYYFMGLKFFIVVHTQGVHTFSIGSPINFAFSLFMISNNR